MDSPHTRGAIWIGVTALSIVLLVGALALYTALLSLLEHHTGLTLPGWLRTAIPFTLFAGIYIPIGYTAARILDRKYPDTPARSVGTPWERPHK